LEELSITIRNIEKAVKDSLMGILKLLMLNSSLKEDKGKTYLIRDNLIVQNSYTANIN
jgi:hypothetical protein